MDLRHVAITLGSAALGALAVGCAAGDPKPGSVLDAAHDDREVAIGESSSDSAQRPTLLGTIADGETVVGSLSESNRYLAWAFEAGAGETIRLWAEDADAGGLDTVLIVYRATPEGRPTGAALAINDDFGGSLSSHLEIEVPDARRYVALVRRYDGGRDGRISLSLELGGGMSTDDCGGCGNGYECAFCDSAWRCIDAGGTC
jgi:hypothetical protein